MEELRDKADEVLQSIEQPLLTDVEYNRLECLPHDNDTEFFYSLAEVLKGRGGEGLALDKLKAVALLNGIVLNLEKKIYSNIFLGAPL